MKFLTATSNESYEPNVVERLAAAYVVELFKLAGTDYQVKLRRLWHAALGSSLCLETPQRTAVPVTQHCMSPVVHANHSNQAHDRIIIMARVMKHNIACQSLGQCCRCTAQTAVHL
jgi:hypothetical protein